MAKQRQDGAAVAEERPPEEDTGDVQKNGQNRAAELRDLLLARRGERHVVAVQDFPDPDAISSALAYREIAGNFDIHADILYEGII
ncbi:MAG: hypothetical protein M3418_03510, partial [Gemmatimonadota bacterium]|nr:hypothetical protein [Gemmatimonadota bacterium]